MKSDFFLVDVQHHCINPQAYNAKHGWYYMRVRLSFVTYS
jgi:hypothetical protein